MEFDQRIFLHALYVAFVYAVLAFGATWYRQTVDNMEIRKVHLGEDIYYTYDPLLLLVIAGLFVVFLIFAFLCLFVWNSTILAYVIPLAVLVNIFQISLRTHFQRMNIKTRGIVGRNVFSGKFEALEYSNVLLGEVQRDAFWDLLTLHYATPEKPREIRLFRRRVSHSARDRVIKIVESSTDARIFRNDADGNDADFLKDIS